jgi:hypothetical protein
MVERYRRKLSPAPAPVAAPARKPSAKSAPPSFVFIPRDFLTHPLIRHRDEAEGVGLSVFEFAIAAAIILLARQARRKTGHRAALQTGREAMRRRRSQRHPIRDTNEFSADEQFQMEGSAGFERGLKRYYEEHNEEDISIKTSRAELLRLAGFSRKAENSRRVSEALSRLEGSIGNFGPVLSHCRPGKTLLLTVTAEWVPVKRFGRLDLPLLTCGPTALALQLFLSAIDESGKTSIRTEELYRRLGIRRSWPAHAIRALECAHRRVNDYRRDLGLETFEIVERPGQRLSFCAVENILDQDEKEEGIDGRQVAWDDEEAYEEAKNQDREEVRSSLGLADDEYLDDDRIDQLRHRQETNQRREASERDRQMFVQFNERIRTRR